jgi:hypothetical protein
VVADVTIPLGRPRDPSIGETKLFHEARGELRAMIEHSHRATRAPVDAWRTPRTDPDDCIGVAVGRGDTVGDPHHHHHRRIHFFQARAWFVHPAGRVASRDGTDFRSLVVLCVIGLTLYGIVAWLEQRVKKAWLG